MTKERKTAAQRHVEAHKQRRLDTLLKRKMPTFGAMQPVHGTAIIADSNGELFRVDVEAGTISRLRWDR